MSSTRGLNARLIDAIKFNDHGEVSNLLEKVNAEAVNGKNLSGETPLHMACRLNNSQILSQLLAIPGMDVNAKDSDGITPLHMSCRNNNCQTLSKLLAMPGIDVNAKDSSGITPMHVVCYKNDSNLLSQLLAKPGIDVNARDCYGITPIWECKTETLRILLNDERVDLDAKDDNGHDLEQVIRKDRMSTNKNIFLELIEKEKMRRNGHVKQESDEESAREAGREVGAKRAGKEPEKNIANVQTRLTQYTKIAKINKNIANNKQIVKKNVVNRKLRMSGLKRKQILEKSTLDLKRKAEDMNLNKRHRNEETTLEGNFEKEIEYENNSLASLKDIRNQHIRYFEKLESDMKSSNEASSKDTSTLEAARGTLECPICLEIMKPPTRIWMCPLSHIICEPCNSKVQLKGGLCPTCSTEMVTLRAFVAENFARTLFNE